MGNPLTATEVASYNANPPPDDGTQVPENEASWADVKTKLSDPLKTAHDTAEAATVAAFGKVIGGGGVLTSSISYEVVAGDQGKLVKMTGSGTTLTTPSAIAVGSPFVFAVLNLSGGNVTLDGNGSQTIDGASTVTLEDTRGCLFFTDGSNWFTAGQNWQFDEPDRSVNLFNGSWLLSVNSNALTIALKNRAGVDATATASVLAAFRSATVTDDGYNVREATAAASLVVPATATLGFSSNEANAICFGLIDVGDGTMVIGVSKLASAWTEDRLVSTTAIDTAADSASVIYTASAQSNKPCRLLGTALITTGATAGNWSNAPSRVTPVVTPYSIQPLDRPLAKAFATFTLSGTTVVFSPSTQGFNIASIVRTDTGDFTITFEAAMPNTNYSILATPNHDSGGRIATYHTLATGSFKITVGSTEGSADPAGMTIVVFGF